MAYEIRLEKKVPKEFLKEIAKMLNHLEKRKYERTLILYFLPDMKTDSGAWATTHFNPNLEVRILGRNILVCFLCNQDNNLNAKYLHVHHPK